MQVAIITARGGSKRIPRKNVRPFLGKPMLAWSIEAAKAAGCFKHILVSTDDEEIGAVAGEYGAEVPFLRPGDLSDDYAPAHKAARHALEWALKEWGPIEAFCHLYPTAPLLSAKTIREGMRLVTDTPFKAAWAMVRIPYPVYQIMAVQEHGGVEQLFPPNKVIMRSQDMPQAVIDTGQAYCFDTQHFLEREMEVGPLLAPVLVSPDTAQDIDTEEDWALAEQVAASLWATRPEG